MKTYLILDASNILYRTFFAHIEQSEDINIGMCHHSALMTMSKYYRKYKADEVVIAFDNYSWRKAYTKNLKNCLTYKRYKSNRRQNLTQKQEETFARFDAHVEEFMQIMKAKTGLIVLERKFLEADDLIAGFTQQFPDDKHIIISSDKDFIQLLSNPNVSVIDPKTDKARDLSEWNFDAGFFIFEKCFRGDTGDAVISSYPRLRRDKIEKAWEDELLKVNLMNHTYTIDVINPDTGTLEQRTYKTGELFEENKMLMDLTAQPEYVRELIVEAIDNAFKNRGKFSYFDFVKFCGKYNLQNIIKGLDNLTPLLSGKGSR